MRYIFRLETIYTLKSFINLYFFIVTGQLLIVFSFPVLLLYSFLMASMTSSVLSEYMMGFNIEGKVWVNELLMILALGCM